MKKNITAWFFEGGSLSIPKNLIGLMEPLGLDFEDLGKMIYLLYCGSDHISKDDAYAQAAAKTLHAKGLIHWFTDTETVDFSPMFDKINESLGEKPKYMAEERTDFSASEFNYADLLKKVERTLGLFLTLKDKQAIQEAVQRYNWSYELLYEIYVTYYKKCRKQYDFKFFCKLAFGACVQDLASFRAFEERLDTTTHKTIEVLKLLGKRNNPSEPQKELYRKWTWDWKFTHEMVLLAVERTTGADNPSLNYVDSILEAWKTKGILTPEDLKAEDGRYEAQKNAAKPSERPKQAATQKFEPEKRDLSFLEE